MELFCSCTAERIYVNYTRYRGEVIWPRDASTFLQRLVEITERRVRKFLWIKIGRACGEPKRDVVRLKLTFPRHELRWHYSITWCIISVFRRVSYRRPYVITINERKKFSGQLIRNWRNIERSIGIPRIYVNRKKWNKLVSNWEKHIDDYVLTVYPALVCFENVIAGALYTRDAHTNRDREPPFTEIRIAA